MQNNIEFTGIDYEDRLSLIEDLRTWLDSEVSEDDILTYTRSISDISSQTVVSDITLSLLNWKIGYLYAYLKDNSLISDENPEDFYEWYRIVTLSAQYNPLSVLRKLAISNERLALVTSLPTGFQSFSLTFTKDWVRRLRLITSFTYLYQLPYLQSLARVFTDKDMMETYLSYIKTIFIRDGKRLQSRLNSTEKERQEDKVTLSRLSLFPDLFIDELLKPENIDQKTIFLSIIITCLNILLETSEAGGTSYNVPKAADALWLQLQNQQARVILAEFVAEKKVDQNNTDWRATFFKNLYELWTEENVKNGLAKTSLIDYVHKVKPRQMELFRRCLELFWSQSPFMALDFDPLPVDDVITALHAVSNRAQLTAIIESVQDNVIDYGQKEYLKICIESMYAVISAVPAQPFQGLNKE